MAKQKIKIIIDTDIGDDIDDALCVSMALGSPEFEILGITTVYGDTEIRSRIAMKLVRAWGRDDIPVITGFERPLQFDFHEGTKPEQCSQRSAVLDDIDSLDRSVSAPAFIADCVQRHPGEVYVLTIGAKTNVAAALSMDPSLASKMAGVYSNAGNLPPKFTETLEWNVRYDPLAASVIARSGVPWTVLGVDVAAKLSMKREQLDAIAAKGLPHTDVLAELVVLYARNKGKGNEDIKTIVDVNSAWVADNDTLFALLYPDIMEYKQGRVEVVGPGYLRFEEDVNGPHRVAQNQLDVKYRDDILQRVLGEKLPAS